MCTLMLNTATFQSARANYKEGNSKHLYHTCHMPDVLLGDYVHYLIYSSSCTYWVDTTFIPNL